MTVGPRGGTRSLRWSTVVQNHAKAIVACDFFVSVTASFRVLYVFVAMEIDSGRIPHTNVIAHPTAGWTIQHFREFLAFDHPCRFVIHDRDKHLLDRCGYCTEGLRRPRFKNSFPSAEGERVLRTSRGNHP
jgi:hypothetical protein